MIKLLQSYSFAEIIIFFLMICFAIKEGIGFYDWAKARGKQVYDKEKIAENENAKLKKELDEMSKVFAQKENSFKIKKEEIDNNFKEISDQISNLTKLVELLISSDKDDIKAYIVEKHHHFCYDKQWIDDYNLDCIEKRYTHYIAEGGNSFIGELMNELRSLPHRPPQYKQ